MKPKAYSYIRFSTPEQAKGDSLRRQLQLSRAYAEKHDLDLDETLRLDAGVSGFHGANLKPEAALGRFLEEIEAGKVTKGSFLLIESLDRLSRTEAPQALAVFTNILNQGVKIVTLADDRVYSIDRLDTTELIMSILIMVRAHDESANKSKRLKAVWEHKRTKLTKEIATSTCPNWLRVKEDRTGFEEIPERVEIVRRIFQMSNSGMGNSAIAKRLNTEDVPRFGRGGAWHNSYIQKTLNNRSVLGEFQPQEVVNGKRFDAGTIVDGYYPQIISQELFYSAHAAAQSRKIVGRGRPSSGTRTLFSGLLRCGRCGGSVRYENKGKSSPKGEILVCTNAKIGRGCEYRTVKYKDFELNFLNYCKDADFKKIIDSESISRETKRLENEKRGYLIEIAELRKKLDNWVDFIGSGKAPKSILEKVSETEDGIVLLNEKISKIDAALVANKRRQVSWEDHQDSVKELLSIINSEDLEESQRKRSALVQYIRSFTRCIYITGKGHEISEVSQMLTIHLEAEKAGLDREKTSKITALYAQELLSKSDHSSFLAFFHSGRVIAVSGIEDEEGSNINEYDFSRDDMLWISENIPETTPESIAGTIRERITSGGYTDEQAHALINICMKVKIGGSKKTWTSPHLIYLPFGEAILKRIANFYL
ncbi:MAG: recombinase family protein [Alcanivoracaceae bacterium]